MTEACKKCGKRSDPDRMTIQGDGYLCVTCYSGDVADRREDLRRTGQWDQGREAGAGPVFQPLDEVVPEPFSMGDSGGRSTADLASRTPEPEVERTPPESGATTADDGFPLTGWVAGLAVVLGLFLRFSSLRVDSVNGDSEVFYRDYGAITAGVVALLFGGLALAQVLKSRSRKGLGLCVSILVMGIVHLIRGFVPFGN